MWSQVNIKTVFKKENRPNQNQQKAWNNPNRWCKLKVMVIVHGFILKHNCCQKHSQIKSNAKLSVEHDFNRKVRQEGAKHTKLIVLKLEILSKTFSTEFKRSQQFAFSPDGSDIPKFRDITDSGKMI